MRWRNVSIPIGFSSSLQLPGESVASKLVEKVSIPIGFSSSLQPLIFFNTNSLHDISFNPYRVFKFVATQGHAHKRWRGGWVSIPIGFSSSLQLISCMWHAPCPSWFQSLSGFQVRCNRTIRVSPSQNSTRFNPYRVFKFVATHWSQRRGRSRLQVSVPIGFSSSLQRIPMLTACW